MSEMTEAGKRGLKKFVLYKDLYDGKRERQYIKRGGVLISKNLLYKLQ